MKLTKKFFFVFACIILFLMMSVGQILFWITRPMVALSHLLMLNIHTAKEVITEWQPRVSLADII